MGLVSKIMPMGGYFDQMSELILRADREELERVRDAGIRQPQLIKTSLLACSLNIYQNELTYNITYKHLEA